MPWPGRGRLTCLLTLPHRARARGQDVLRVRDDELLHHRRKRERDELRSDALDGSVEVVERLLLDERRDFGAPPQARDGFMRDDAAIRLLLRGDECLFVERLERPRVVDL